MSKNCSFLSGSRIRASGVHLGLSAIVAGCAALLVFQIWYPYPYQKISGGQELFVLLVSVDVIMGPLITLAVFDKRKPLRELRRDLAIVVLLQLFALGYGLWTMSMARPVHLVFEIDRFRVVHAIDVPPELLDQTRPGIVALPYRGPTVLGLRPFKDDLEKMHATLAALQGLQLSYRPEFWQSYDASRNDVLRIAKPIEQLKARFPDSVRQIEAATAGKAEAARTILYVPLSGRKDFWTVLIDGRNGDILGYLPLDSF
ncbi:TfpX/TfpZ family type IV pilin accessory protein [Rhodoferax mekongensis]|uniref:TfpX/TfpZ family type IV pilin accessory protein n=1 Tax=Rhodoferax mekongensis TaxID=3068341 RepID=A0ABZ0B1Q4_9BURK|nr:TfpX/TfpZ family type IV pilin accessory protein [Rhodoferax sp. TBRC 17307]WNO05570.1 TfpX/TfpZ family type IV pilin accessory protein [Rhodoferax sp. TBRC 17307]